MSMPAGRASHFVGLEALIKNEQQAAKGLFELSKATREAAEEVGRIASRALEPQRAFAAAVAPQAKGGEGNGLDTGALTGAIRRAETPLVSFGAHIDAIFDRLAGTTIEAFRRIDANTKFPTIDKAFKAIGSAADDTFRFLSGRTRKVRDDVGGTVESLERSIVSLEGSIKGVGSAAQMAPLEASLKEVSATFTSIDASLKTTADAFKALTPAAQPAADIIKEMASEAGKVAAAAPLLFKDFAKTPKRSPGLRDQQHRIVRPPKDAAAPAPAPAPLHIVPARPAPALAAGYAEVMKSFASQGVAGAAKVGGAFQSLNAKVQAVKVKLDGIPVRKIIAVSGSALLAGKAISRIVASAGGVSGAISTIGAASVTAFGVTVKGSTLAGLAFTALTAATGLGGLELVALGARAALATVVVVKLGRALYNVKFFTSSLGDVASKTFSQMFRGAISLINPFNKATAAVSRTGSTTARVTASVKGLTGEIAAALGIVAVADKVTRSVTGFFTAGVKGASDLAEATSAAKVTFGKFAGQVSGQARQMAKDYGLSQKAQLDVAAGFGEMAMGAGMAQDKSAEFANTFTKLAADLNSRKNFAGGFEEAATKISAALAGESEPLRRLGVNIDEAAVKAKVAQRASQGLTKSVGEQAEMEARAALIQEGLASATGDLARTSDSAANQFRKAGGGLSNFGISIGEVLLPAVTAGTMAFNDLLGVIVETFEANKPLFDSWAARAKSAFELAGAGARNLGTVWAIVKLKTTEVMSNILSWIEVLPANLARFGEWMANNWVKLIAEAWDRVTSVFQHAGAYIGEYVYALWEMLSNPGSEFHPPKWEGFFAGFKAEAEAMPGIIKPALMDSSKQINAEMAKLWADAEAHRKPLAAEAEAARKPAAQLAATAKEKRHGDFADLAEVGSKEAYTAVIKHSAPSKDTDTKKIARTAEEQLKVARDQLIEMRKRGMAVPVFN